jgi:Phage integrase family
MFGAGEPGADRRDRLGYRDAAPAAQPGRHPHLRGHHHARRSASKSGDTKTPKSKRSLELPKRAIIALTACGQRQARERQAASEAWHDKNRVFCHENGDPYTSDQLNWRFSKMTRKAGIGRWHAHEGRHTAVSIMSSNGVRSRKSATPWATSQPTSPKPSTAT